MSSKSVSVVTAANVRDYFRADAKRMARLSPEAQRTVADGARGRLHPQAIKEFNGKRKAHRRYFLGASGVAKTERAEHRESLRAAGVPVGKRGPLPKAAKTVLSQSK